MTLHRSWRHKMKDKNIKSSQIKCELGANLQQAIIDTNFPITKELNGMKYADPFADVDELIKTYSYKVIAIKRYIIAKAIVNTEEFISSGRAKAKNLEDWAKQRLDKLKEDAEQFNKAHPYVNILGDEEEDDN